MKIKNLLMMAMFSLIGQSVVAATIGVFNNTLNKIWVKIYWPGGKKVEVIESKKKKSLSSGYNSIDAIHWGDAVDGGETYGLLLSISNKVSLSHEISIAQKGWYQYDKGKAFRAKVIALVDLDNDGWTEIN
jgi:hypothetical protein